MVVLSSDVKIIVIGDSSVADVTEDMIDGENKGISSKSNPPRLPITLVLDGMLRNVR